MEREDPVQMAARFLQRNTRAEEVWLFGSRARGDDASDSDMDFMLVFPDDATATAVDKDVEDATWRLSVLPDMPGVDAVAIIRSAFYHNIADLHPGSVTFACRTEGRRLL